MGKKYSRPPIIEAVCEFRLTADTPWDSTVAGRFYEKLESEFPHREQKLVLEEAEFTREPHGFQQRMRATERVLFFSEDRRMLIQVGPRLLVVNALKPYPSWQGFKPKIQAAWNYLREVVAVKGIERIGLRYINEITLEANSHGIEEYLAFYPHTGDRLPRRRVSFIVGAEFPYAEDRDRCRVLLRSEAGVSKVILDIHYFLARPEAADPSLAMEWVENAHDNIEAVFEGCITDRLRKEFEGNAGHAAE